jgi:hypothetical protein
MRQVTRASENATAGYGEDWGQGEGSPEVIPAPHARSSFHVGSALRMQRQRLGLTLDDVARALAVSEERLRDVETHRWPTGRTARAYLRFLADRSEGTWVAALADRLRRQLRSRSRGPAGSNDGGRRS